MATKIMFRCQTCQAEFPLMTGALRSDSMGGARADVGARDAEHAHAFVKDITEHRCENKDIRMENNYAKVD